MTSDEIQEWRARYDLAEVRPIPVMPEGANSARCHASNLARATMAGSMYSGEILAMPELREAELRRSAPGGYGFRVGVVLDAASGLDDRSFVAESVS